jgi:hypothetical protein
VWVDTFDMMKGIGADKSCMPSDAGEPDLSNGDFNGVFDYGVAPNGMQAPLLFLGDCRDAR